MDRHELTTPFGRRSVSLGHIATQIATARAIEEARQPGSNHPVAVNKWQLFRTLTEIRDRLALSDRALSVLHALLSFHPETALSLPPAHPMNTDDAFDDANPSCELVVFPSNKALSLRAHGMSEATLRRHLAALVDAGLLIRRDSPNGKRYARKAGRAPGERFADAFGFDLTPLVARVPEFEALAEQARRAAATRQVLKERVSLLRRDVGKLIALGLEEGLPGEWDAYRLRYLALMTPIRRLKDDGTLSEMARALDQLRSDVAKTLNSNPNAQNMHGNADYSERHQSNSKTQFPTDFEPASEKSRGAATVADGMTTSDGQGEAEPPYSLGMVMEACPDVREYAPGETVRSWNDFIDAVRTIRPMIGISPDAWREALDALGQLEAHVVVATILQRSIHSSEAETIAGGKPGSTAVVVNGSPAIQSAGGYLRALTDKARAGAFSLGPVLMALIGQRLKARRAAR